ncbi:MAG TPA: inorganic diphosphatase [Candidatus Paceibacterota bacterium]|jgi:inorganic pyrophosphatase|nr:inorganic diphosphatase [Candidatus Paceibacterota bacterium]
MNPFRDIAPGDNIPEDINVYIETPQGSSNKYELNKETGMIQLDRANYSGIPFPFNYGFVPQTLWHDGDALDVVLLTSFPIPAGILVPARPIGFMEMQDTGEGDAKIIAVPLEDRRWDDMKDISDVNRHMVKEIKQFFETYKALKSKPAEVVVGEFKNREAALSAIKEGCELYKKSDK